MLVVASRFFLPKNISGIALWPFVVVRKIEMMDDPIFVNHEKIHLRQQAEMLVFPFYFWYVLEFLFHLVRHKNWPRAYRNISFEREAFANEKDLRYLKRRPFWRFLKYV